MSLLNLVLIPEEVFYVLINVLLFLCSFIASFLLSIYLSRKIKKFGFLKPDLHKKGKPLIPTLGGLSPLLSFLLTSILYINLFKLKPSKLIAAVFPAFFGLTGLYDDFTSLNKYEKVLLGFLATAILLTFQILRNSKVPLQSLILPFIFTCLSGSFIVNATNTLAGFNGLEAGLSLIVSLYLLLLSLMNNKPIFLVVIFMGCLLGFFLLNFYPAKIFPGNVGTFFFGGFIVTYAVTTNEVIYVLPLFIPHLMDFFLKLKVKLESKTGSPAKISEKGKLQPPSYPSLLGFLISKTQPTEKELVAFTLFLEALIASALLLIFKTVPLPSFLQLLFLSP